MSAFEEFHHEERVTLIENLDRALSGMAKLSSATWACLWLSDIEKLRGFVTRAETCPEDILAQLENHDVEHLRKWTSPRVPASTATSTTTVPRKRTATESPTRLPRPVQSSVTNQRSEAAKNACSERDRGACIIEKVQDPVDKCHIFPFALGKEPEGSTQFLFWARLKTYWSAAKIEAWKRQVTGRDRTEHCANLICLSPSAHRLWGKARFALKPFEPSEDKKKMDLQFFWMPTYQYAKIARLTTPPSIPSDLRHGNLNAKLWNGDQDKRILSGDIITITTEDPENHPLPSFELLQMQWVLNRVVAISGAADVTDDELDDDDDASGDMYPLLEETLSSPSMSAVFSQPASRQPSQSPSRQRGTKENQSPQRSSSKVRELHDTSSTSPRRLPLR
ncbi:hypothetical protein DTO207G8_713 [Paecilomyces variotii]|nr:hypothetical protein DTO207G8_713 [Paecilomyces variotii]KAJ9267403.1 hypothetical protein DTO195F2_636 [Paecilomyces variotii]KAJ9390652.1 hypothetical protein DTO063F5_1602 [Paecilomyces variotii]